MGKSKKKQKSELNKKNTKHIAKKDSSTHKSINKNKGRYKKLTSQERSVKYRKTIEKLGLLPYFNKIKILNRDALALERQEKWEEGAQLRLEAKLLREKMNRIKAKKLKSISSSTSTNEDDSYLEMEFTKSRVKKLKPRQAKLRALDTLADFSDKGSDVSDSETIRIEPSYLKHELKNEISTVKKEFRDVKKEVQYSKTNLVSFSIFNIKNYKSNIITNSPSSSQHQETEDQSITEDEIPSREEETTNTTQQKPEIFSPPVTHKEEEESNRMTSIFWDMGDLELPDLNNELQQGTTEDVTKDFSKQVNGQDNQDTEQNQQIKISRLIN